MVQAFQKTLVITKTKETLISEFRNTNVEDDFWFEDVVDTAKGTLKSLGFNGVEYAFSGFWSKGDGGSFTLDSMYFMTLDELESVEVCEAFEALKQDLIGIYRGAYTTLEQAYNGPRATLDNIFRQLIESGDYAISRHSSSYCHYNTISMAGQEEPYSLLDFLSSEDNKVSDSILITTLDNFAASILEFVKAFGNELYSLLEKEHNYLTSDSVVWETIEANDYFGYVEVSP